MRDRDQREAGDRHRPPPVAVAPEARPRHGEGGDREHEGGRVLPCPARFLRPHRLAVAGDDGGRAAQVGVEARQRLAQRQPCQEEGEEAGRRGVPDGAPSSRAWDHHGDRQRHAAPMGTRLSFTSAATPTAAAVAIAVVERHGRPCSLTAKARTSASAASSSTSTFQVTTLAIEVGERPHGDRVQHPAPRPGQSDGDGGDREEVERQGGVPEAGVHEPRLGDEPERAVGEHELRAPDEAPVAALVEPGQPRVVHREVAHELVDGHRRGRDEEAEAHVDRPRRGPSWTGCLDGARASTRSRPSQATRSAVGERAVGVVHVGLDVDGRGHRRRLADRLLDAVHGRRPPHARRDRAANSTLHGDEQLLGAEVLGADVDELSHVGVGPRWRRGWRPGRRCRRPRR